MRHQVCQAETQKASTDNAVSPRVLEAYEWLLVQQEPRHSRSVHYPAQLITEGQLQRSVRFLPISSCQFAQRLRERRGDAFRRE